MTIFNLGYFQANFFDWVPRRTRTTYQLYGSCDQKDFLTTFIELGMFDLRHVKFSVDTIQQVFLDNLMHNNGNQQVEKDGWQIL